ncbi:unnamed protein product [Peronospora belbahrii]|uniref:Secreted protein n=1 Tax=Peronospora belbahrii TaxID=622444 RepID=A0AAU9LAC5_9STRA|nr:unnamed protein product [Peronospora belbahrii]
MFGCVLLVTESTVIHKFILRVHETESQLLHLSLILASCVCVPDFLHSHLDKLATSKTKGLDTRVFVSTPNRRPFA